MGEKVEISRALLEKREYQKDFARKHILRLSDGTIVYDLNKRPYPYHCEVCGEDVSKSKKRLAYHHWYDNDPEAGIWLCHPCHMMAECIDSGLQERYLELKKSILANMNFWRQHKED